MQQVQVCQFDELKHLLLNAYDHLLVVETGLLTISELIGSDLLFPNQVGVFRHDTELLRYIEILVYLILEQ